MLKIQNLWDKAQKKLSGQKLAEIYADLVVQDNAELELKKIKAKGLDEEGLKEAEVRENFVGIIYRYKLEEHFPDDKIDSSKNEIPVDVSPVKLKDQRLQKLWKKAETAGFSENELEKLKQEFGHQQLKLDEYDALKDEMKSMEDIMDNTVDSKANKKSYKEKNKMLKQQHRDIKDTYEKLEGLATRTSEQPEFKDIRIFELWALAKRANMSEDELNSFKEELVHFENRIKKHEYVQEQLKLSELDMKEKHKDGVYSQKHKQLEETARTYEKRVHKHHADMKKRVEKAIAARHSEL